MHPDVRKLLEVQKVDQSIAKIQRDLDSIPRERGKREATLDALRRRHAELADAVRQAELASRSSETSIRQLDDEIKKLEGRLNAVRNNAEYQATLLQIGSVRQERGRLEEEGLNLLERIETMRAELTAVKAQLDDAERVFADFVREGEVFLAKRRADLERVSVGRDQLVAVVPPDVMDRYSRLFAARDSLAVCAVEGNTCTGCYTNVPPNLLSKLLGGTSVVNCNSCQRILFVAE